MKKLTLHSIKMDIKELTYWVTLALMSGISVVRKNQLYVGYDLHQPRYLIIDLFESFQVRKEIGVTPVEELLFKKEYSNLQAKASMVDNILREGYHIIPIISKDHPKALKANLKYEAPCSIFIKGNRSLLNNEAIAIVGSRKANEVSLDFTTNIARKAVEGNKVIVSGFAKGVDRRALDVALQYGGSSKVVLPQGIATFEHGYIQYSKPISEGKLIVLSTFHPYADWSVAQAMARNPIIYGLASEIYVASSESKGGTWSGVMDGLRKGRRIFVGKPNHNETNANNLLIRKGCIGVDLFGNIL